MSNASPQASRTDQHSRLAAAGRRLARATGFWTAVSLPYVLLVVLVTGGAQRHPLAFAALLGLNLLALLAGHNYDR